MLYLGLQGELVLRPVDQFHYIKRVKFLRSMISVIDYSHYLFFLPSYYLIIFLAFSSISYAYLGCIKHPLAAVYSMRQQRSLGESRIRRAHQGE